MRSKCKTSTKDKLYRSLTCEMIEEINRLSEKSRRSPDRMNDQLYHYQADKSKCCKKIDGDPNHMEMREIERENRRLKGTNQTHFNEQRKSRNQLIKEIIEEELTQLSDVLMKKAEQQDNSKGTSGVEESLKNPKIEFTESKYSRLRRLDGRDGLIGPGGPMGPAGNDGQMGLEGPAGKEGPRGLAGPEGKEGPRGLEGPEGKEGPRGLEGSEGKEGPEGPRGPEGKEGKEGPRGPEGKEGTRGPEGPSGQEGLMGPIGPRGPKGKKGEIGPRGIQGYPGDEGDRGQRGSSGPKGLKGDPGSIGEKGEPGEKGDKGEKGDQGEKGQQGEKGEKGEQGPQGIAITSVATLDDYQEWQEFTSALIAQNIRNVDLSTCVEELSNQLTQKSRGQLLLFVDRYVPIEQIVGIRFSTTNIQSISRSLFDQDLAESNADVLITSDSYKLTDQLKQYKASGKSVHIITNGAGKFEDLQSMKIVNVGKALVLTKTLVADDLDELITDQEYYMLGIHHISSLQEIILI